LRNSILNASLLSFTIETVLSFQHPRITILTAFELSAFRTAGFRGLYFPLSLLRNFIEYVTRAEINVHMAHGKNCIFHFFYVFRPSFAFFFVTHISKVPTVAVHPNKVSRIKENGGRIPFFYPQFLHVTGDFVQLCLLSFLNMSVLWLYKVGINFERVM